MSFLTLEGALARVNQFPSYLLIAINQHCREPILPPPDIRTSKPNTALTGVQVLELPSGMLD